MGKKASGDFHHYAEQHQQLDQEQYFLLELGRDITKVREKSDLLVLFKNKIKEHFYFTHVIVTLVDPSDETYTPFLLDDEGSAIRTHPRYRELSAMHFSLKDGFVNEVLASEDPVSFELEKIMNQPRTAPFLKVNYEEGVRELLMTRLVSEGKTMGFVHVYSDKLDSFTPAFRRVMKYMAPLLSGAVANIIKNEEVLRKEREKAILLDFASAIAKVHTKEALNQLITRFVSRVSRDISYIIARAHHDQQSLSTFCYHIGGGQAAEAVDELLRPEDNKLSDGLQARIFNSAIPLLLNVDREIKRGVRSDYLRVFQLLDTEHFVAFRLQVAGVNQGFFLLNVKKINVELLSGFCALIAIAMANILAGELVTRKQQEQTFLLDFARESTHIRNREDLKTAIFKVLDGMIHTKLAMIRVIADDGVHLPVFMYDPTMFTQAKAHFTKKAHAEVTVDEPYNKEVLASEEGAVFNVEDELRKGNDYARLWKTTGLKNVYALPMRTRDRNIGTIWLLADKLNASLVKGLCAHISIAISNVLASEKLLAYKQQLEEENDYLKQQIQSIYNFSEIIGDSQPMKEVYRLMQLVADTDTTVLILGETGTGKELIARALHGASRRKEKLMVKVNCAALPSHLIESELFGHEKGAFTGAVSRRIGKFELADNSTLFLDEIGELPLEAQAKILRAIQEKEIERLGGKQTIRVNVRLVAATNRNLAEAVKQGSFRADLYFRLNVFPIVLPPLRERKEDIEALSRFFIEKYSRATGRKITKVAASVFRQLLSYPWPGNVRELEHLMERAILLSPEGLLEHIEMPQQSVAESGQAIEADHRSLAEVERSYILSILKQCGGKISGPGGAAEILMLPANTLHSKIKKLEIRKSEYFD